MSLIILSTLVDIYKPVTREGEIPKLIKRNLKCKKSFESNAIHVEQYIKPNGEISKRWCNIKDGDSYYRIDHSFEYVSKLLSPLYISGYKRWEK